MPIIFKTRPDKFWNILFGSVCIMNLPIDYKLYYDEPNFHRSNNLIQLPEGVRSRSHKASGKRDKLSNQNKGQ